MNLQAVVFGGARPRPHVLAFAWVASSDIDRARGLAGVAQLPPHEGLLIERAGGSVLTMRGMLIPIDAVLVDRGGRVLHVLELELGDPDVSLGDAVDVVIELPQGFARANGIAAGARVRRVAFVRTDRAPIVRP